MIDWNPNDFPDRNPCICSNPPNQFYKFYPCEKNRDHDAWRPRGHETCPICEDEKKSITFRHLGVKQNGKFINLADDSKVIIPSPDELIQLTIDRAEQEKQAQKSRELRIIQLLEQIAKQNQPLEDHEMMYK